jgi:hypothetical protein
MALWAWRNRDELLRWTIFAANAVPRVIEGEGGDVAAEARLRAKLTADPRTRGVPGLRVEVEDGVAILSGVVDGPVHDVVVDLATSTAGVTRVRDELQDYDRRGKFASAVPRS